MDAERVWLTMRGPTSKRFSRQPMGVQWLATIDFAIAYARGDIAYRRTWVSRTGERYWYWPGSASPTGWWLIPGRVCQRVQDLYDAAERTEAHAHGTVSPEQIAARLRRWRDTGHWRRIACRCLPRHPGPKPRRGRSSRVVVLPLP